MNTKLRSLRLALEKEKEKSYRRLREGHLQFLHSCAILKILSQFFYDKILFYLFFSLMRKLRLRDFIQAEWLAQGHGAESQATDLLTAKAQFFSLFQTEAALASSPLLYKFTPLPESREGTG